ncbi:type VII secretion protein EccE [Mycobacterium sp.]|uniref:type VII secretion protein EccE n=1 Tax=Mycobacterium sp. TaxID=1785 RepID=UPI003D6C1626
MRSHQAISPRTGRLIVVLLAVVVAAVAYPWQSVRERWVLGIAVAVVIVLLAWWRGLFVTTILRRRVAIMRRNRRRRPARESGIDVRTTALLHIAPPETESDLLPLPLIAQYLDRYGIHAYALRVTSRAVESEVERQTWIGLTVSALDNLPALRARAPRIPLHETAEVAVRRLADHLRETGRAASVVGPDDLPQLRPARETWRAIRDEADDYLAAYRVKVDTALSETLAAIESYPARATWTVLEIADDGTGQTVAVGCAFRTAAKPRSGGPLAGLAPHSGNHRPALMTLHPLSTQRLDGHSAAPADLLVRLRWPGAAARQSRARHAAV